MTARKSMALVGSLLLAVVAAAARLDAADEIAVPSNEEQRAIAAYESALQADAMRTAAQLKKEAAESTWAVAVVGRSLLWICFSTAAGGVVLLGCCVVARRQQKVNRAEWSHAILALGQRHRPEPISAFADIPMSIRFARDQRPKPRGAPVVVAPAVSRQWKRAA